MNNYIPLSVPNLKGNEIKYVTDALEKEWVSTGGAYIDRFEKELAAYLHTENAVACQSGTAGLHLALILAGVKPKDEVVVPTLTFIAAVNPVKYLGAEPIFMDCDDSLCMDMDKLKKFCEEECVFDGKTLINKKTRRSIKAVIVVHVFGNMANMEKGVAIAKKYHLFLIEDATEALGTYYTKGTYRGCYAGTIGDIGVYSFNGNKIITTGGGGMLISKDSNIAKSGKYLSTQAKDDTIKFIHHEVGYNYRMTNLQAAVGVAQFELLDQFIKTKKENYEIYQREINQIKGLKILEFDNDINPNYWFYSLYIEDETLYSRDTLMRLLEIAGIQTRPVWALIHEQKPYQNAENYCIEKAIEVQKRIINLPCSSNLKREDVEKVIWCIKNLESVD